MNSAVQGWEKGTKPIPSTTFPGEGTQECMCVCVLGRGWGEGMGVAKQTDTDRWSHPHPVGPRGGCAPPVHHMWLTAAAHSVRDQLWWQLGRWGVSAMGPRGAGEEGKGRTEGPGRAGVRERVRKGG